MSVHWCTLTYDDYLLLIYIDAHWCTLMHIDVHRFRMDVQWKNNQFTLMHIGIHIISYSTLMYVDVYINFNDVYWCLMTNYEIKLISLDLFYYLSLMYINVHSDMPNSNMHFMYFQKVCLISSYINVFQCTSMHFFVH